MNKFDQAKWILERNLHWIAAAEAKIGFVVTLDLAMLGALAGFYGNAKSHPLSLSILVLLTTSLLVCSLLSAACSFKPRLDGPDSVIYFGKISESDLQDYIDKYNELSEAELHNDLLKQIHRNAQIATEKHKHVRNAIRWAVVTLPSWSIAIIIGSVVP